MHLAIRHFTIYISKFWTRYFAMLAALYISLALLAPVLIIANAQQIAEKLYTAYSIFCHQNAYKSWYLYPSPNLPGFNLSSSFNNLYKRPLGTFLESREFIGSVELGWKTALCHRCTAIYLGVFTASLMYHILKTRRLHIPILHPYIYLAGGLLPISIHTLVAPQSALSFLHFPVIDPYIIRTITGGLFGVMSIWFAFPEIDRYFQRYISKYSKSGLSSR